MPFFHPPSSTWEFMGELYSIFSFRCYATLYELHQRLWKRRPKARVGIDSIDARFRLISRLIAIRKIGIFCEIMNKDCYGYCYDCKVWNNPGSFHNFLSRHNSFYRVYFPHLVMSPLRRAFFQLLAGKAIKFIRLASQRPQQDAKFIPHRRHRGTHSCASW